MQKGVLVVNSTTMGVKFGSAFDKLDILFYRCVFVRVCVYVCVCVCMLLARRPTLVRAIAVQGSAYNHLGFNVCVCALVCVRVCVYTHRSKITSWLSNQEDDYRFIILEGDYAATHWSSVCLSQVCVCVPVTDVCVRVCLCVHV